jgi:glycosyltransferase involved in cell wall biosynthesis
MKPLKVLQFITPAGFYGAERWVLALANNLNHEQVTCDLAVSEEGAGQDLSLLDYYPAEAGSIHKVPMRGRFDWRAIERLARLIKAQQVDLIHTHGYKSDIIGLLAARRAGIKCVSTPHGFSGKVGWKMGLFIRAGTFMLRFFDAVAPLSEELVRDMARFNVPDRKVRFIRNGVDLREIDAALAELPEQVDSAGEGAREKEPVFTIGFIGQMIPRKGIPELLAVFDRLHQRRPNTRLKLVGDGNQRVELENITRSLASREAIEFLGFRNDRLALLTSFDLFAMTSSLEGIPRCMMEAMACSVPVAGYEIPGVDQLLKGGKTGFSAPHRDREALLACFEAAMDDPGDARARAQKARALIDETYSAARMAREYEALFDQLVAGTKPARTGSRA